MPSPIIESNATIGVSVYNFRNREQMSLSDQTFAAALPVSDALILRLEAVAGPSGQKIAASPDIGVLKNKNRIALDSVSMPSMPSVSTSPRPPHARSGSFVSGRGKPDRTAYSCQKNAQQDRSHEHWRGTCRFLSGGDGPVHSMTRRLWPDTVSAMSSFAHL